MSRPAAPVTDPGWLADRLRAAASVLPRELRCKLPEHASAPLALYLDRLLAWGERINLTGARSAEALVDEHLADALPVLAQLPGGAFSGIDVGSGGGLPGVVLAVLRPDSDWTLLEPNQKKAAFLAQLRRDLEGSAQLEVVRGRLEDHLGGVASAGVAHYDVAISRAVWDAENWLGRGRELVRPGGCLIGLRTDTGQPPPSGSRMFPYTLTVGEGVRRRAILRVDL